MTPAILTTRLTTRQVEAYTRSLKLLKEDLAKIPAQCVARIKELTDNIRHHETLLGIGSISVHGDRPSGLMVGVALPAKAAAKKEAKPKALVEKPKVVEVPEKQIQEIPVTVTETGQIEMVLVVDAPRELPKNGERRKFEIRKKEPMEDKKSIQDPPGAEYPPQWMLELEPGNHIDLAKTNGGGKLSRRLRNLNSNKKAI